MKRIVSIFLSVLLILMLSGAASAEGELIKTEKDAVEAAEQELEVWKEMGLLCPEVSLEGEPDSIVEIEPRTGDDYWYGREFSHAYEVRWWMAARIDTELEVPAYGCNLRIPWGEEEAVAQKVLGFPDGYLIPCFIGIGRPAPDAVLTKQIDLHLDELIHWEKF